MNRIILVTGGANGLGAALVRRFASAGDRVAIADSDVVAGRELADRTGSLFVPTDIGSFSDNQAAVNAAVERFGGLNCVCLNAGIPGGTSIGDRFNPHHYRRSMEVNLDGVVYGANAALPHLRAGSHSAILITASIAGVSPAIDVYYAAAKHALIGLTRSLALLLHEERITVNAICPGFINTHIIDTVRNRLVANGFAIAEPDEIAAVAASILESPATGQAWEVQAGKPAAPIAFPPITLSRL